MAVKVSWTSWAVACTAGCSGLGIHERSQGNTAKLQKTQICVCGSAGTKHKAPEMEGRLLPPARLMLLVLQCSPTVSWESIYLQKKCSMHWPSQFPEMQLLLPAVYWLSPGCWGLPSAWPKGEKPSQLERGTGYSSFVVCMSTESTCIMLRALTPCFL